MVYIRRDCLRYVLCKPNFISQLCSTNPFHNCFSFYFRFVYFALNSITHYSVCSSQLNSGANTFKDMNFLARTPLVQSSVVRPNESFSPSVHGLLCSFYSTKAPSRSFRRRRSKRLKAASKPVLDQARFERAIGQLPPRFSNEELCDVLTSQDDPLVCLEIYNWALQQPRFKHDVSTYHVTIKKLGVAKMYQEMDDVVNQVLAVPYIGNEALYNTIVYFFVEARKLTRAVIIFKHMKKSRNLDCRPSIRTYNILFAGMLSRGKNSYINHMYMDTIRCLFKQMVNEGIEPDIFSLNSMIKGYVLSLHVNDALIIFHQMGVVYNCLPNSFTYDYLIHGLCAQGRTNNARDLCDEMKKKGFGPSSKSYNSLVNALALNREVEAALNYLSEMIEKHISVDFITFRTLLDEICRRGMVGEAMNLLKDWQEKELVDGHSYMKLLHMLEDDFGNSNRRNQIRY